MRIKHRKLLRTKEQRQLIQHLGKTPNFLHNSLKSSSKTPVELIILEDRTEFYLIQGRLWLISKANLIFPGLPALLDGDVQLPQVVVDKGAVPHIANGADVMAPGIVDMDATIIQGEFVVIVDQQNRTPIAVGSVLKTAEEIHDERRGRAIKTLHYVGDPLWQLVKEQFN